MPELTLLLATDLAVVDHHDGSRLARRERDQLRRHRRAGRRRARRRRRAARRDAGGAAAARPSPRSRCWRTSPSRELAFRSTREEFEDSVRTGQEAIRDGEVFQVVLSQRLDLDCPAEPIDVYRVLRTINPSPYMYYLQLQDADGRDFAVVGSSPETLVKVTSGRVVTLPDRRARARAARRPTRTAGCRTRCSPTPRSGPSTSCWSTCPATTWSRCASRPASRSSSSWRSSATPTSCTSARRSSGALREGATALQTLVATFPAGTLSGCAQAARDRAHRRDRARSPRHLRRHGRLLRLRRATWTWPSPSARR